MVQFDNDLVDLSGGSNIFLSEISSQSPPRVEYMSQPSSQIFEPSSQISQPSSQISQPSSQISQPSSQISQPSSQVSQPSSQVSQPSSQVSQPSSQVSQPSSHVSQPSSQILGTDFIREQFAQMCSAPAPPAVRGSRSPVQKKTREQLFGRSVRVPSNHLSGPHSSQTATPARSCA
eukprot:GHVL01019849.1.p1 GENE.GHVL01019849.1~~GHVL01019849.1.p1  ORF type:complete len:191 (-),score=54.23 GHVL01019849.1:1-528(-)